MWQQQQQLQQGLSILFPHCNRSGGNQLTNPWCTPITKTLWVIKRDREIPIAEATSPTNHNYPNTYFE
jgi:hypothetical protein